ncbi:hypothetical protein [Paenisporosarcina sp. OV554]|nr:hypothetical protein [Paenisporosarcina sp. OV554]
MSKLPFSDAKEFSDFVQPVVLLRQPGVTLRQPRATLRQPRQ